MVPMPDQITRFCDFDDCTLDPVVRRGTQFFCQPHREELESAEADSALLCACGADAEYQVGEEQLCRACADDAASQGPASGRFLATRLSQPFLARAVAALSGACDFDECQAGATESREAMQFCLEHARQHDAIMSEWAREQAKLREQRLAVLTKHLEAAQAALVAWFVDACWLIFLEVSPRGLGLRLERSAATVASCQLRAESDARELARELLDAVEAVS
jgi:hypothetical protein